MSSFEPNKRHLRELLIYLFNLKKSAAEAHRLLVETYGEAALSERSCGIGSIIVSRFVPNARRTIRWTILRIKQKVWFFHNKCPILVKKRRKLICRPDISPCLFQLFVSEVLARKQNPKSWTIVAKGGLTR